MGAVVAAAVVVLITAGFLIMLDRINARHAAERRAWAVQQQWLLQRIQAPTVAVAQFDPTPDEPDPEVSEEEMRVFHSEQDEILHNAGRLMGT